MEIITATNNFSTVLGRGGFGYVYKGTLANGVDVAVKVLSDASQQGEQEFLNEVHILSCYLDFGLVIIGLNLPL
jgi:predicted Ser/Thr protein kinase